MKKRLVIICLVIFVAGIGVYLLIKHRNSVNTAAKTAVFGSSDVKVSQKEDLYLPTKLPVGYEINQSSVTSPEDTKEVVLIELQSQKGPSIFVSEQPLPKDFNFDDFVKNFENKEEFAVAAGKATYGTIVGNTKGIISIVGDKQWIIINGPGEVPKESFKLIAEGLKK